MPENFIKNYWVDPDSEEFEKEFDARTLSEQGFSIGKGSLNLDSLKHRGIEWATLHSMCICMVMLLVAKTAVEIGRADLTRCIVFSFVTSLFTSIPLLSVEIDSLADSNAICIREAYARSSAVFKSFLTLLYTSIP